jgi:hypothetical protein
MALTKFSIKNQNRILWCIVDNTDKCASSWSREVAVNLTDYMIYKCDQYEFDIFIGNDENEILQEAAKELYSHAVVVASGTSFKLSDRIFSKINELCDKDFFIAGHILDREDSFYKNAYYELHHQFYVVNLAEYEQLGQPSIGEEISGPYEQVKPNRSEDYLHGDRQVPVWISPGTKIKTYDYRCHGWNIISVALANNKTLIDLGEDVRNSKKYFYYEHDHVFLKEASLLYFNQFFCINFITAVNSDSIRSNIPFTGPVEQYITVGTGFNWIKNLETVGFTNSTTVTFTDNNLNCLQFMKAMVTEWDGKDYASFYASKMNILPNEIYFSMDDYVNSVNDQWNNFVNSFDNWDDTWSKIKELTYEFIHIDYTAEYNLNWIVPNKNTLINLSDLFNHVPYVSTQPLKYRIGCENRLLDRLTKKDPNITLILAVRSSSGFHPSQSRGMIGKVSDFDLIDMNQLNRPPWHAVDWNHTGCRPLGLD